MFRVRAGGTKFRISIIWLIWPFAPPFSRISSPCPHRRWEVSVVLSDDASASDLNRDWRGRDKPTNVLLPKWRTGRSRPAFHCRRRDPCLPRRLSRRRPGMGSPGKPHLIHLIVHGCLHLLGHDHQIEAEAEEVEALEVSLLQALGYPDPYAERTDQDSDGAANGREGMAIASGAGSVSGPGSRSEWTGGSSGGVLKRILRAFGLAKNGGSSVRETLEELIERSPQC